MSATASKKAPTPDRASRGGRYVLSVAKYTTVCGGLCDASPFRLKLSDLTFAWLHERGLGLVRGTKSDFAEAIWDILT